MTSLTPALHALRETMPTILGVANRTEYKQRTLDALDRGVTSVTFDFRHCRYIESVGLGMLVSLSRLCRSAKVPFVLANLDEDLTNLFAITYLDSLFTVTEEGVSATA